MKRNIIAAIACALVLSASALLMAACGAQNQSSSASSSTSSSGSSASLSAASASSSSSASSSVSNIPSIGQGNTSVEVTNETGYDITGVRVKLHSDENYSDANSFDGFTFADGSTVKLNFDASGEDASYDVLLLTSVDSKIAVRDIKLTSLKGIAFRFDQGIGFITYTDPVSGEGADNRSEARSGETADAQGKSTHDTENQAG